MTSFNEIIGNIDAKLREQLKDYKYSKESSDLLEIEETHQPPSDEAKKEKKPVKKKAVTKKEKNDKS